MANGYCTMISSSRFKARARSADSNYFEGWQDWGPVNRKILALPVRLLKPRRYGHGPGNGARDHDSGAGLPGAL